MTRAGRLLESLTGFKGPKIDYNKPASFKVFVWDKVHERRGKYILTLKVGSIKEEVIKTALTKALKTRVASLEDERAKLEWIAILSDGRAIWLEFERLGTPSEIPTPFI